MINKIKTVVDILYDLFYNIELARAMLNIKRVQNTFSFFVQFLIEKHFLLLKISGLLITMLSNM